MKHGLFSLRNFRINHYINSVLDLFEHFSSFFFFGFAHVSYGTEIIATALVFPGGVKVIVGSISGLVTPKTLKLVTASQPSTRSLRRCVSME